MSPDRELVLVGAGGFAREVADLVVALNDAGPHRIRLLGAVADPLPEDGLMEARGVPVLGGLAELKAMPASVEYVVAIGNGDVRRRIVGELGDRTAATLVHPNAYVGGQVEIGPGAIICSHASVTSDITIGAHAHVNLNCTIGHDARIEEYATLSPLVGISGYVVIGAGATLGTGAVVIPHVTVGAGATIGAGASVVRDIPPHCTAVGVPAKVISAPTP